VNDRRTVEMTGDSFGRPASESSTFGNRAVSVPCFQFERDGSFTRREISKTEIIEYARKKTALPPPRLVKRWLNAYNEQSPNLDMLSEELDITGDYKKQRKVLRKYLKTSLQPRDLRQVDPAFPQKPAIWVRHSAIIASLEQVRSIIFHDTMLLFDPDNSVVKKCTQFVQETLYSSGYEKMFLPFEFRALEGFIIFVTTVLEFDFLRVSEEVKKSIGDPRSMLTTTVLEDMRIDKQKLSHFISRACKVHDVITHLLEDDEDMANLYLTEKHRSPWVIRDSLDHEEAEMILESYLQIMDDLTTKAKLLDHEIDDTEDLVSIHLDTLRNRLIMMQMLLSVIGLGVALGSLVAGMFGMNLPIPIFESEFSQWWFLGTSVLIIGLLVVIPFFSLYYLRKQSLYSGSIRSPTGNFDGVD